ncbi:MAG: helix-turn-helix domain-containing protein [Myxococcota bacterium]
MARPADPHAHEALRTAARREFVKSGIQKARIEDITHACGLSKGAFYLHFDSKEALFRELVSELEAEFEVLRTVRERRSRDFLAQHGPVKPKDLKPGSPFVRALKALHTREDQKLLELLWQWRDVIDVLLRGSQGTEFDGVMWRIIDREVARVQVECEALKAVRLMRDDIPGEALGLMMVGTYLLVARRLSSLEEKPDFDLWVTSLQKLLHEGTAPRPHLRTMKSSPLVVASSRRALTRAARDSRRSLS